MIVIDKITGKSFRTKEEYDQYLKLIREKVKTELNYSSLRIDKIKELTSKKNKTPEDHKELKSELFCLSQCLNWLKLNI